MHNNNSIIKTIKKGLDFLLFLDLYKKVSTTTNKSVTMMPIKWSFPDKWWYSQYARLWLAPRNNEKTQDHLEKVW